VRARVCVCHMCAYVTRAHSVLIVLLHLGQVSVHVCVCACVQSLNARIARSEMVAMAFLLAHLFRSSRTAVIVGYIIVIFTAILAGAVIDTYVVYDVRRAR
jgi:hypothetical protein